MLTLGTYGLFYPRKIQAVASRHTRAGVLGTWRSQQKFIDSRWYVVQVRVIGLAMYLMATPLIIGFFGGFPTRIWIVPGATAEHVVFGFGTRKANGGGIALESFRIQPCALPHAQAPVTPTWVLEPALQSDGAKYHFVRWVPYGAPPPGFRTRLGPASLAPGCYLATAQGVGQRSGTVRFLVDSARRIREL